MPGAKRAHEQAAPEATTSGLSGGVLALGPAFGTFAGGMLTARLGWQPVLLLFGLVSLLRLLPWHTATRDSSHRMAA